MEPIRILYFSDVLCIWAYIAQIRLDELKSAFGNQISFEFHFTPVFGDARRKLEKNWEGRGGLAGYSQHIKEVAGKFEHIPIHPEIWTKQIPDSSTSCHLFLRAIKIVEDKGLIEPNIEGGAFERATWSFRSAFFQNQENIAQRQVQLALAKELGFPTEEIEAVIASGEAYADLSRDFELVKEYTATISPTLIFNEGRQRLNGNVGYRVIEANIRELLYSPTEAHSWC